MFFERFRSGGKPPFLTLRCIYLIESKRLERLSRRLGKIGSDNLSGKEGGLARLFID